ncbi:MAG: hypothetical protein A2Y62_01785 [Candidatus Fischerbacteria bacterium RBG_13_37_8]|uniref:Uncharacterized protein n=1 Tax=Candidatus Fischerbacteria bacterium RBG_13_37_8 TaxID=1817863 RepID=A0A1F5VDL9_9BACT|nr:MAG: hypothetical protein A2Y62_01785 [Candidatus Fischerbacteria bacterium RBG_13_37_8]
MKKWVFGFAFEDTFDIYFDISFFAVGGGAFESGVGKIGAVIGTSGFDEYSGFIEFFGSVEFVGFI